MCKKFIAAILLLIFSVGAATAGVTNIKEIVNNTSGVAIVKAWDDFWSGNGNLLIPKRIPADGIWTGNLWIPWADNAKQFTVQNVVIEVKIPVTNQKDSLTIFCFWQSGDYVRFNDKAVFIENAPRVPGMAKVDGERRLIITERNKKAVFKFEEYKK